MIFCLAYELCCVDKMKLFSSILASAFVFHLVHSIVIKINPIRVQVRPNYTANTSSSANPFSSEISAQFRTTTDKLASNASSGCGSKAQNQVVTDPVTTEQSVASGGDAENEIPSDEMAAQQPSGTENSAGLTTTLNSNVTKYFLVTESSSEYRTSVNQIVTLQSIENLSSIFLITTYRSITEGSFGVDNSTQYSNITGEEVTKSSSFSLITDAIAANGSNSEHDIYIKTHLTANTTLKSLKVGPSCKIAYPISSPVNKDESTPPNEISEAVTKIASTVKLSSVKTSALDIQPDFSPEVTTEKNSQGFTDSPENADESQRISSSSSYFSLSAHSDSSSSGKSDFSTISSEGGLSADSEVQISAPISVKTATPHSEGYPDFEDNEPHELSPLIRLSTLLDDKKSSTEYEINQEASKVTFSSAGAASQSSSDFVTLLRMKENSSVACKISSASPIISSAKEITKALTTSSISSVTEESKLRETVAESESDSSQTVSLENFKSDLEMQTGVSLVGEEDQIVSTIEIPWFHKSVTPSSTAESKMNASTEAIDNPTVQKEISSQIGTTVHIQETTQPNQLKHNSSITNNSATAVPLLVTKDTMRAETSVDQSSEISNLMFTLAISIPQSSAANISENNTTAFHRLTESSRAADFGQGNLSSSEAVSRRPICKTTNTNHSSCPSNLCKTVSVQRTSTSKALTEEEKKVRRLTISNKNPNLAKKLTRVTPLKGNISSNAGFLMVNRKYGARLFFWFVRSLHNATEAPVIVWLQGQPGWSSLVGLFEEHGPYRVVETENGIQFELREHAWTNEFNVLYLDHCIGCGYSTAMRKAAYEPTFEMVSANVYQALVQFFEVFSEYAENEVYLAGEHGCAKYIPVIADTIHSKNAIQQEQINLRGILIGGPYIDTVSMTSYSEYLYVIGLIDEREYENLFIREEYAKSLILANKYNETIAYLKQNVYNKIEQAGYQRLYDLRFEKPAHGHYTFERYMQKLVKYEPFVSSIHAEGLQFRTQSELLIEEIMKPVDNILTTILQHYKVLYYNGQFDMLTPYCLTARYFSQLHWAHTDLFYSSQLNNWDATHSGYPDGYWKFSSNLTHVMIRDAGHTVGTTKPLALLVMLRWFVSDMFETSYSPPSPDQRYLNIFI